MDDGLVSIGAVAKRFGIQPSALRYYEEQGLLRPAARRAGRRYYGPEELRRLALIQIYTNTGLMSLAQVKEILAATTKSQKFQEILRSHVELLNQQIARAEHARETLEHHLTCGYEYPMRCPWLLEHLQGVLDRGDAGNA
ncbi:MerR family transcriptional regulator [Amycolatopsis anabasis]|uniref:MerR family transcriptional regulator n=1 Tax=Amycolatopsis anabasis TaxID=1840409 RepID=UPI00131DB74F|nr:MerR family transcriptional regulator [Amycolatopsis anabasis]